MLTMARNVKKLDPICFEYEKLFGLDNSAGKPVIDDLKKYFGHANGAFRFGNDGERVTAYNLGQQSVINYILAQIDTAKQNTTSEK